MLVLMSPNLSGAYVLDNPHLAAPQPPLSPTILTLFIPQLLLHLFHFSDPLNLTSLLQ